MSPKTHNSAQAKSKIPNLRLILGRCELNILDKQLKQDETADRNPYSEQLDENPFCKVWDKRSIRYSVKPIFTKKNRIVMIKRSIIEIWIAIRLILIKNKLKNYKQKLKQSDKLINFSIQESFSVFHPYQIRSKKFLTPV